ncbi:MAG: hypothetical protein QXL82_03375 [Candidatus Aenigmatarchaeota archaeon]
MSREINQENETISKKVCAAEVVNRLKNVNFYLIIIAALNFLAFIISPFAFFITIVFLLIALVFAAHLYMRNKNEIEQLKNKYDI